MSLLVAKGSFNAEVATGNKAYTGIGFQPKALLLFATRQSATGFSAGEALSFGMAVSPTSRKTVGVAADDNAALSNTGRGIRDSALVVFADGGGVSGSIGVELDLVSFDSDGFTLNYLVASAGKDYLIHYIALGGSDITNAYIGQQSFGSGGGTVTGVGFRPDFVFVAGTNGTSGAGPGGNFVIGAASSPARQGSAAHRSTDAVTPTTVASYERTDRLGVAIATGADTVTELSLVQFDADGFTFTETTSTQFAFLCLRGGSYWVGSDTQKTSTGLQSKTGIGFTPKGLLLFGANKAASASLDTSQAKLSIGASDGVNEGSIWGADEDNVATTDTNSYSTSSRVLVHASNPSTLDAEASVSSFEYDGYTLNYPTADATPREFIAVAFGDAAPFAGRAPLDFNRKAFPFIIGDGFMQGVTRAGLGAKRMGHRMGPSPIGGFERSLFPRLHSVYVASSSIDVNLALLQETSAELSMAATRDVALALLAETDTPSAMAAQKAAALALLSELDSFSSIPASKAAALGLLSSTNTLLGASPLKQALLAQLLETDTLQSPAAQKNALLGQLLETDFLFNFSGVPINVVLGLLAEADAMLAAGGNKAVPMGLLTQTNSLLSAAGVRVVPLGLLAANHTLLGVAPTKAAQLGLLSTTSSQLPLAGTKNALLSILSESDLLQHITGSRNVSLGLLTEADLLRAIQIAMTSDVLLGILSESDSLFLIRPPRGLFLEPVDPNLLILLEAVKRFP